jgi:enoyl-[acyl-carrier protein] reductase/trans-2-enoyl-CoA reductase (NAD+)
MKDKGTHENCIEQIYRLYHDHLYAAGDLHLDADGQIRLDDLEMQADIQQQITATWPQITTENLLALTDIEGYRDEFYRLFGFHADGIDYDKDINPQVKIPSIETTTV